MAFNFDDYENSKDYTFTYPALELLNSEYQKWLRKWKKKVPTLEHREFIIRFVKDRITFGCRKYGEFEPEWETLLYYIEECEKEFNSGDGTALERAVILYDQALLLLCEGLPLPPNIL